MSEISAKAMDESLVLAQAKTDKGWAEFLKKYSYPQPQPVAPPVPQGGANALR